MKRRIQKYKHLLLFILLFLGWTSVVHAEEPAPSMMELIEAAGYQVSESDRPASVVLIDGNTGKYLWGENPDFTHNPASVMKLMTLYMVYEAMAEGKFDLETTIVGTDRYQGISQIYALSNSPIVTGVAYPVKELIPMVLVPSSNVATLMLADLVEPDPVLFLQKMNEKAQALGMNQTQIYNATGAQISAFQELYVPAEIDGSGLSPWEDNATTARDLAVLVYHLLQNYPEILAYTATPQYTVMQGTPYEATFDSYNYSLTGLRHEYEGVDGLKTGSSGSGGFNIAITAQREEFRLIAIVLGVGDWANQEGEYLRHPFANAALTYGFEHFEYRELLNAGEQEINGENLLVEAPLWDTVEKGQTLAFQVEENQIGLQESLPRVAENIAPKSVAVTPVNLSTKVMKSVADKVPSSFFERLEGRFSFGKGLQVGWFFLAGGLLLLLFLNLRTRSRRRQARRNRGRK
ncbi:serine hydrolase [Enterococcus sp. LJL98]